LFTVQLLKGHLPSPELEEQNDPSTSATINSGITYSEAAPWNSGSLQD